MGLEFIKYFWSIIDDNTIGYIAPLFYKEWLLGIVVLFETPDNLSKILFDESDYLSEVLDILFTHYEYFKYLEDDLTCVQFFDFHYDLQEIMATANEYSFLIVDKYIPYRSSTDNFVLGFLILGVEMFDDPFYFNIFVDPKDPNRIELIANLSNVLGNHWPSKVMNINYYLSDNFYTLENIPTFETIYENYPFSDIIINEYSISKLILDFEGLMQNEYSHIIFAFIFSLGLSLIIFFLSYFLIFQEPDLEKISPYECGFQPFEDTRSKFDIRFYLVAILFIIFDLEIMFLFPWSLAVDSLGFLGFFSMMVFLFILTIGFLYEWKKKALDW